MNYPAPNPPYVGPPAHSSPGSNMPVRRIVIHSTVSPCVPGGARATGRYFKSPSSGGSAHYVVDPHEVVQATFDSVIAWHAPPNQHSIGIELCDMPNQHVGRWDDRFHREVLARTARLVAELCLAYGVPMRKIGPVGLRLGRKGVCGHVDVSKAFRQSTHWDPGAFPWRKFMRMVRAEAAKIKRQHKR